MEETERSKLFWEVIFNLEFSNWKIFWNRLRIKLEFFSKSQIPPYILWRYDSHNIYFLVQKKNYVIPQKPEKFLEQYLKNITKKNLG